MTANAEITYLNGDATSPVSTGIKIIVHICNDIGGWGAGFVLALSKKWKAPEEHYRSWYHTKEGFHLGAVQFVQVTSHIHVANMIGQQGIKTGSKGPPIRYEAVDTGLAAVAEKASELEASVHMPRIGCGLAGGKWEKIEPLIDRNLLERGIPVFVYDWP